MSKTGNVLHGEVHCLAARGVVSFPVRLAVGIAVVHMLTVGAGVGEAFETFATLEGFLPAVKTLVFGEVMFVLEGFGTVDTFVGALT